MLEVSGKKAHSKVLGIPNDKAIVASTPRNYMIRSRVFNDVIGLVEEWWRT